MLNKLIKALLQHKIHRSPEWMATTFSIDEATDVHVVVETLRNGKHFYGTREDVVSNASNA